MRNVFLPFVHFLVTAITTVSVSALFVEDAGVLDFTIATTGHGVDTKFVHSVVPQRDGPSVITSDGSSSSSSLTTTSCTVASRSRFDGSLEWRRNVCSHPQDTLGQHAIVAEAPGGGDLFFTNDVYGNVRAWTAQEGALVWDIPPSSSSFPFAATEQQQQQQEYQYQPQVWSVVHTYNKKRNLVAATVFDNEGGNTVLSLYNAIDGTVLGSIDAKKAIGGGSSSSSSSSSTTLKWLHILPHVTDDRKVQALIGHVSTSTTANKKHNDDNDEEDVVASKVTLVEMTVQYNDDGDADTNDDHVVQVTSTTKLSLDSNFLVSSLVVVHQSVGDGGNGVWHALALDAKRTRLVQFSHAFSQVVNMSMLHPLWTSMEAILPVSSLDDDVGNMMIRIVGRDNRYSPSPRNSMALFRYDSTANIWDQWYAVDGEEESQFRGIAYCPKSDLVIAVEYSDDVTAFNVKPVQTPQDGSSDRLSKGDRHRIFSPLTVGDVVGDTVSISEQDAVSGFDVVECNEQSVSILLTTTRGTTILQTVSRNDETGKQEVVVDWTAEEGLSQVSDALLLDASHPASVLDAVSEEEEAEALRHLSFSARLQSQMDDIMSFVTSTGSTSSRDVEFGFVKVAVMLSQSAHRIWGIPTSGSSRGTVAWMVDLPQSAVWHSLVHGTASSKTEVHGINGGTHSPEVLVLSSFADSTLEWTCLDGTTGQVHSSGTTTVLSPVAQVMPLFGGFGMCRQLAVIVHEDRSISVVPGDDNGKETVREHLHATRNGLYTHTVNRETGVLESFEIVEENSAFVAKLVGRTDFPGEQVVKVSYPHRDEAVQAPCHILGDDSLLLKYLNPHLAVVVTMSTETASQEENELLLALNSVGSSGKRKPAGVTPSGETVQPETKVAEDAPNLFVNVVDTVSGRVLYRASHSNASPKESIPVLISENWVFYAFFNEKIRRTEVGVFTLYEGMIDKNGLTAFHSPDQSLTFSSLDARDAKPVVLTKTYVLPKPVNALGITSTRGGISSRLVIFATGDDRLMTVPRELLEPRRPFGDVKESEKLEGLLKYTPLLPLVSLWSPSYNKTVNAEAIISTSTGLESQSLVLAYGGADVFFTRMAPSKGFDLLPETFNRTLLSIVVFGLLVALTVVRNMSTKKLVKMAWS